ncbi:MAG TPA: hypothetical protein DDX39_04675 [Bacteroidales bacterium]|nr:MAG: hypothetical protein A2W98_01805 [Bacteroidetes bacterium GWF2_33_38]OFY73753.1 MAG: hypothetical protein A2265_10335 [Bacteroidetes bacterium RIFOXYA12_FULL_33_9]OFY90024.1 MAG: hypothetical protein A2236_11775 [Bacteroidetes bacterium RIFOXYA2_FULL_33_7]HBF87919.1 hypothetical protein [Bacteroidales bacterium]
MEIIIGSDEMILWLRKNGKAMDISNDIIGKKIREKLKETLGINPIEFDKQSHWANKTGDKNINELNLPKTSAQYLIDIQNIQSIYEMLDSEFLNY